jgi:hypothetical protein
MVSLSYTRDLVAYLFSEGLPSRWLVVVVCVSSCA